MAEQMRPASKSDAPDPAHTYERSDPKREAGMGKTGKPNTPPHEEPDGMEQAVSNRQDGSRQLNAHDSVPQPDHSMKDEEPMGSDQRPIDATDPQNKRHPRTGGKGGTPDAGEAGKHS